MKAQKMPLMTKIVSGSAKIDVYVKNTISGGSDNKTALFGGLVFANGRKPVILKHCYLRGFRRL